ncbi:TonB-dependent siderophore receptor [Xanthomonas campestris pv. raphani]|uniref:TonB-dependent receptor n=1 Tax=Xanthomonas campestris TaxID=339 RepID=UPI002367F049|nr:TonB-dependent siderophore receptor [Xanthomonas campestris]MEA9825679.1 TonB-dependent siderophore receptor [Xanthomonas campestris pv. raphani]MEA9853824.1 TonB-dependent siderophore receptor [Xanthomonas campestris pv. raphani]MEA9858082.1 TonB-dependent siderophore receptor [Xanthomonas campestris pv. raphani]MEA9967075.1 TonB-dependent siderophore receptor [Xanthomonas campestris pv. raphani]WDJ23663.1 TonB-dependent siderophore receptor [Xanthomonas campestris pv. raphani]
MTPRISPLTSAVLLTLSAPAFAQPGDAPAPPGAVDLDAIRVQQERAQKPSSPKYTEALRDTPQTITVVTKQTMDQQNLLSLRDVLSTLPGITFGAGEGGGGYGDSINLRGFTASSDITTDGVRDSAQYSRSDTFNLEAVELINGANSAMSGAGSVGGNINLVTKTAGQGDFTNVLIGGGSDRYGRLTVDSNYDFENGTAVRLNAMGHTQDVPGRDEEFRHRWGFAPSVAFGLGSDTRFTLSYLHQHDNNLPQYGVPFALSPFNDGPLPGVDRETYYGYRNVSRQEIDVDMLTGVLEMDFDDNVKLRSLARVQRVDQTTTATAPEGTWCLPNNTNAYTGRACVGQPPSTWNPNSGPRGLVRETENFIAHSQTDLTATLHTGAIEHRVVAGVAFSKEDFELDSGSIFRNADGSTTGITYPLQTFDNPYNIWTGPQNYFRTGRSKGSLTNQAVYLFDTLQFNEQWMLNLGGRYEHNEGDSTTYTVNATGGVTGVTPGFPAGSEENLFSYRAGLVFKPVDNASLYLSYANSKTPSKASVNGSCTPIATATVGANCNVEPESAVNIELGGKWDVLNERLALTAAVFRNERENYKVNSGDPLIPEQVLDGKARVDGIALGAAGYLTERWSVFANYTFLDSEVLQSVSNRTASLTGDPIAGRELVQTPRNAGNLWTTYQLNEWTFGYGVNYQGSFYPNNTSTAVYRKTDAYWVHRAMVGLRVNDWLSLQLNVNNLFDKEYYTSIRNNLTVNAAGTVTAGSGWALPGDGRSAVLNATFSF